MAQSTEGTLDTGYSAQAEKRTFKANMARMWNVWRRKPFGIIGGLLVVTVIFIALFSGTLAPNPPGEFVGSRLESPSSQFPLGTDSLGRDVLSRTIFGARISIAAGLVAATGAVGFGTFFGVVSGYMGGWVDMTIQRMLEVLASFPAIVLALILVSVLGRANASGDNLFVTMWDLRSLEAAIMVVFLFGIMRVIRAAVIRERGLPYVEAAQSIGASTPRILTRHILPNVLPYVIVAFSTIIGTVILVEAALSFLGFGVSSGTPSWGIDLSTRNREYFNVAPWLIIGPGLGLSLTVMGYNFLGDALRDILDPRLRGSR